MTNALDQLRQLRDRLRSELDKSETFVAWSAVTEAIAQADAKLAAATEINATPDWHALLPGSIKDKACEIVAARGHPLSTQQVYEALTAIGVVIGGTIPMKNLRTILSKCDRLVSVQIGPSSRDDRGWWLADRSPLQTKEKGPADQSAEPSQSNGATSSYTLTGH